jgi:hypothetical protein
MPKTVQYSSLSYTIFAKKLSEIPDAIKEIQDLPDQAVRIKVDFVPKAVYKHFLG